MAPVVSDCTLLVTITWSLHLSDVLTAPAVQTGLTSSVISVCQSSVISSCSSPLSLLVSTSLLSFALASVKHQQTPVHIKQSVKTSVRCKCLWLICYNINSIHLSFWRTQSHQTARQCATVMRCVNTVIYLQTVISCLTVLNNTFWQT